MSCPLNLHSAPCQLYTKKTGKRGRSSETTASITSREVPSPRILHAQARPESLGFHVNYPISLKGSTTNTLGVIGINPCIFHYLIRGGYVKVEVYSKPRTVPSESAIYFNLTPFNKILNVFRKTSAGFSLHFALDECSFPLLWTVMYLNNKLHLFELPLITLYWWHREENFFAIDLTSTYLSTSY